jgi:hypothetical protein
MPLNPHLKILVTKEIGGSGHGANLFGNHVVNVSNGVQRALPACSRIIELRNMKHIEAGSQMVDSKELLTKISDASLESEFFSPLPPNYKKGKTRYVFVMGTVMSGLGKGIFSSCLAKHRLGHAQPLPPR